MKFPRYPTGFKVRPFKPMVRRFPVIAKTIPPKKAPSPSFSPNKNLTAPPLSATKSPTLPTGAAAPVLSTPPSVGATPSPPNKKPTGLQDTPPKVKNKKKKKSKPSLGAASNA